MIAANDNRDKRYPGGIVAGKIRRTEVLISSEILKGISLAYDKHALVGGQGTMSVTNASGTRIFDGRTREANESARVRTKLNL